MTLQECYGKLGGSYDEVISRLRSERLVQKFVLKFLDDGSYETLVRAVGEKNQEEAFRAARRDPERRIWAAATARRAMLRIRAGMMHMAISKAEKLPPAAALLRRPPYRP